MFMKKGGDEEREREREREIFKVNAYVRYK